MGEHEAYPWRTVHANASALREAKKQPVASSSASARCASLSRWKPRRRAAFRATRVAVRWARSIAWPHTSSRSHPSATVCAQFVDEHTPARACLRTYDPTRPGLVSHAAMATACSIGNNWMTRACWICAASPSSPSCATCGEPCNNPDVLALSQKYHGTVAGVTRALPTYRPRFALSRSVERNQR